MQLSSLILSATALLAQSASGFLIRCPELDRLAYSFARVHYDLETRRNFVGFRHSDDQSYAEILLNSDGSLADGFVLREVGDDEWLFTKEGPDDDEPTDIRAPFRVNSEDEFQYVGQGGGAWNVCEEPELGGYKIIYSRTPLQRDVYIGGCVSHSLVTNRH